MKTKVTIVATLIAMLAFLFSCDKENENARKPPENSDQIQVKQSTPQGSRIKFKNEDDAECKDALDHYNLGVALDRQGTSKLDEAIKNYRKVIELTPKFSVAYLDLGVALYRQRKLDEAIMNYRKTIEFDPVFAGAFYELGHALHDQAMALRGTDAITKFNEAVKNLLTANHYNPKNAMIYYDLGVVLFHQAREEASIEFVCADSHSGIFLIPAYFSLCFLIAFAILSGVRLYFLINCRRPGEALSKYSVFRTSAISPSSGSNWNVRMKFSTSMVSKRAFSGSVGRCLVTAWAFMQMTMMSSNPAMSAAAL